jgi:hypothetical protein
MTTVWAWYLMGILTVGPRWVKPARSFLFDYSAGLVLLTFWPILFLTQVIIHVRKQRSGKR